MRPRVITCLATLAALAACTNQPPPAPSTRADQAPTAPAAQSEVVSKTALETPADLASNEREEEPPGLFAEDSDSSARSDPKEPSPEPAAPPVSSDPPPRLEEEAARPLRKNKSVTKRYAKRGPTPSARPRSASAPRPRPAPKPPAKIKLSTAPQEASAELKKSDSASYDDALSDKPGDAAPVGGAGYGVGTGTGRGYGGGTGTGRGSGGSSGTITGLTGTGTEASVAPQTTTKAPTYADGDAFYENTYQGGSGARARIEELVENGVVIDGKSVPLDALTAEYRQPFPLPFDSALGLSVGSEHRSLLAAGGRTIIQVGIQGMKTETPTRPPLRLSLVIDRSGSMAKEDRMKKVKEAAKQLISKLAKGDEIAIVAFDYKAEVLCPMGPADRPEVLAAIEKLKASGGTNIYNGMELGYKELQSLPTSDEGFRATLLFSDGEVTAGVKEPASFDQLARSAFASEISTTTFGVGLSFNEALMMKVSQSGKGNYHFLRDAAGAEEAISQELEEYTHVVASDVLVRVKLADGVKLVRVLGSRALDEQETRKVKADEELLDDRARAELGISEDRSKDDDEGIKTLIPQFYMADTHVVLMEVEIPAGKDTRPVAEVFLKYKDLVFTRNQSSSQTITVKTAKDKEAVISSLDSSVKKNILGFQTGEVLLQAAESLRSGKNKEAARALEAQSELLAAAAKLWVDEDLMRDAELVGRYQEVVSSLGAKSLAGTEEGEALAKAFAFSGYQMGR